MTVAFAGIATLSVLLGTAERAGAEAEVLARVDAFARAFEAADTVALDSLLTEDYVHCNSDGSRLTREAWLTWLASRKAEIAAGQFRWDRYRNTEVEVRIHGDAAVVTGINESRGVRKGQPFQSRLRFTQVWVRGAAGWRRAAFHDSRIASPQPPTAETQAGTP